ncbi:MAG: MBOAT family protein [Phycisphaerales bacterium]|nr:MAG: MBOAT family protein [Phycisphaerales bacterium]
MLFNSFVFAAFFFVVSAFCLASMRRLVVQNLLLLVASYFFYGWWDWRFLSLIALSTVIDFLCGREIDRRTKSTEPSSSPSTRGHSPEERIHQDEVAAAGAYAHSPRARKAFLIISVTANLGILGFFKYFDFFVTGCADLLNTIGLPLSPRLLNVVLPVGISFYTFQTLSYTIDVYRGVIRAERSLLNFAVFVAFFPQLVAGPILRARDFLPQVCRPRQLRASHVYDGSYLILWGLFKKVVIADNLAMEVDRVFGAETLPHGGAVLVAVYAFAVQIYCDFSGYTDIARGVARMMGFDIPLNFNLPYFARNPSEFWRRWHISLSSWLRDYLYIPLGGSRKGPRRTAINLALTMILGGLWHGAAWTFVLWGVYHGVLLVVHKAVKPYLQSWARLVPRRCVILHDWIIIAGFFHLTCVGWLIFRAESVEQIPRMLAAAVTSFSLTGSGIKTLVAYALPLVLLQVAQYYKDDLLLVLRWPVLARGLAYCAMFYGLVLYGGRSDAPFIYFQF